MNLFLRWDLTFVMSIWHKNCVKKENIKINLTLVAFYNHRILCASLMACENFKFNPRTTFKIFNNFEGKKDDTWFLITVKMLLWCVFWHITRWNIRTRDLKTYLSTRKIIPLLLCRNRHMKNFSLSAQNNCFQCVFSLSASSNSQHW